MPITLKRVRGDASSSIRERMETLAQAIRDKDIDALMSHYAQDVIVYDVLPPLEVRGADAYRKNFERWFASMQGPIDYQMNDVHVSMSDAQAFCHCLSHITGTSAGGEKADYWVRVTTSFRKMNGKWLVSHEHVSMPANME
jgi:uncharacterized protein (TIGR02246 family)